MNVLFTSAKGTGKKVFSPLGQEQGKEERECCKSHPRNSLQGLPDPIELSLHQETNPNFSYSYRNVRAWLGPFWRTFRCLQQPVTLRKSYSWASLKPMTVIQSPEMALQIAFKDFWLELIQLQKQANPPNF